MEWGQVAIFNKVHGEGLKETRESTMCLSGGSIF